MSEYPEGRSADPAYDLPSQRRFLDEPPKSLARTAFERDRARMLHSAGLRRLGAKTQVLGPSQDDFVRTRLTHSLEVAQIGRELGKILGCNPDVVETACLAHDIGHPPFGHNGERALNEVARSIGGFEGNAQTLRLLTRLEAKALSNDRSVGLNLTRASLDATCKYPWAAGAAPVRPDGSQSTKYGVYQEDAEVFGWLRTGAPYGQRCIEAQVMDLSDDVAYSVHDVEDAIASGRLDPRLLVDDRLIARVIEDTLAWYGSAVTADDLAQALQRLAAEPYWVSEFTGSRSDLAQLKNMTSQLIGRWCANVEEATRAAHGEGRLVRYNASLVIPDETLAEITMMKGISVHFVMAPREAEPLYLTQRTTLFDLADALMNSNGADLEPAFAADWHAASGESERLRVVVDQLASLTDTSARQWHARLCGMFSEL
ncbi:deoxyguanosinetriphosphate triphosphohydrolase [Bowdeniella nasicola]|uniref:Deoxyguanosinetriphosphate triphosphohydrolase n=1 Tax=Bowdeniella nasicola TaxID=208480 RepID=A0A1Q5Q310_9ACTO|nr:deoxyguanosinetriphosphate triphosphohydrolase [Bowdeniella nasicola]OKL54079.1 deoxyguanosinetriphosphate triphosphohydrolase [Bowdeniella nasicola]